eukprot:m.217699 g.217699  ORF g.217699 m.217699 type:complete len:121 (+) comp17204_c0_seq32:1270-1632(+)
MFRSRLNWIACLASSPGDKAMYSWMRAIVRDLRNQPDGWAFKEPVDREIYPEYYQLITHPTDLKTIASQIKDKVLKTREEFLEEVRRMFANCRTFNAPGSDYHTMADRMETFLKARLLQS